MSKRKTIQSIKLLSPSTRRFLREARHTPGFRSFDLLHGYIYARWPFLYIGIGTGEHRLAKLYLRLKDHPLRPRP